MCKFNAGPFLAGTCLVVLCELNTKHSLQLCTNEITENFVVWTLGRTRCQVMERKMQSGRRDYCGNQEG